MGVTPRTRLNARCRVPALGIPARRATVAMPSPEYKGTDGQKESFTAGFVRGFAGGRQSLTEWFPDGVDDHTGDALADAITAQVIAHRPASRVDGGLSSAARRLS